MPISSAYAAIDNFFNSSSEPQQIEIAVDYKNTHDSLELDIDGHVTLIDDQDIHEILFADNSHDNQGSGSTSFSLFTQVFHDSADWTHVYIDEGERYQLTSVSQPKEIRPPIFC